ncbi:MAG TPA: Hsp20/alpha crystallin family protein [Chthonomonadaceae bacterium]|nr:Hsp20/alpha crystallin family protein [Chthonomonadaceae bacterium]
MNLLRYDRDPFDTLMRLQDVFTPRAAQQPREHVSSRVWSPTVDVYEDGNAIVIKADLPGMKQEDIDIEMNGDVLTIRGERKFEDEEHRDNYVRVERQYGAFQRSFTIGVPIEAEQVKATYRSGILELTIPKAVAVKPKKVQVSTE